MRDASHQSIGAEILGLSAENMNMFRKFARNISESRKWCSYWEISKDNKPAPVDYQNDNDFWYNLNANFDVLYACRRLCEWTGNRQYISDPVFLDFFEKTMNQYVEAWKLQADSLLSRPGNLNVDPNLLKRFRRGYGLPSYAEGVPNLAMSTDLIAAIYQGYISWARILELNGNKAESQGNLRKASAYSSLLENKWWDPASNLFNTWYLYDGKFGKGEGEAYLLWFDILKDTTKIRHTVNNLASRKWNVENTSYFPVLLYRNGYWGKAYSYLLFCSDPSTKRREYPEVSFGVIEGIVCGLMGIEGDAESGTLTTFHRSAGNTISEIERLQILNTYIRVKHEGPEKTTLENTGKQSLVWKAQFAGESSRAFNGKRRIKIQTETLKNGMNVSYTKVRVIPGQTVTITVKK